MSAEARAVWAPAQVVEAVPVTDRIRRITLRRPPTRRAAPGSHVQVAVRTPYGDDVRSYSVVESSADGALLTLSVLRTRDSRGGSAFMHGLEVGDELGCTQPLQGFALRHGAARYVLLAGGVGITALIEMGRVLRRLDQDYRFVVVGRSRDQLAYLAELEAEHGDRLEVHADDEGTALDVEALVAGLAGGGRTELYLCGPIRLMDAVRRAWQAAGRPLADLRYETFGSSGWFDPEAFVVDLPELGISTPVGPGASLLDALEAAGADLMWDCRKGECGLCEVRISALHGRVDHRDVFLSEAEQAGGASLCLCVSRVVAPPDDVPGSGRLTLSLARAEPAPG